MTTAFYNLEVLDTVHANDQQFIYMSCHTAGAMRTWGTGLGGAGNVPWSLS